ncbi:molybdenum cofactor guanylyltransferase [Colwelliaceae bacterium 6471]
MGKANKLYGVILAGGKSSRMGKDKATLSIDNETMLERNTKLLESIGVDQVVISRNEPGYLADLYPGHGPMAGIHSALNDTKCITKDNALIIVPIDMPLLDHQLLTELVNCGQAMHCALYFSDYQLPLYLPNTMGNRDYAELVAKSDQDRSIKRFLNIINSASIKTTAIDKLHNMNNIEQWQQAVNELYEQQVNETMRSQHGV